MVGAVRVSNKAVGHSLLMVVSVVGGLWQHLQDWATTDRGFRVLSSDDT